MPNYTTPRDSILSAKASSNSTGVSRPRGELSGILRYLTRSTLIS